MQTQILRRNCDNPSCGKQVDLPLGNMKPMDEAELSGWVVLTKEHVLTTGQAPQPLTKLGCCSSCAMEILRNGLLELNPGKAN